MFGEGLALSALIQPRIDLGNNSSHSGMGLSTILSLIKGGKKKHPKTFTSQPDVDNFLAGTLFTGASRLCQIDKANHATRACIYTRIFRIQERKQNVVRYSRNPCTWVTGQRDPMEAQPVW